MPKSNYTITDEIMNTLENRAEMLRLENEALKAHLSRLEYTLSKIAATTIYDRYNAKKIVEAARQALDTEKALT